MAQKVISIVGIGDVVILKRKGQRTVRIGITGSKVRVTQPTWLPFSAGEAFLHSRVDWIKQHQKDEQLFIDGQQIGISHTLRLAKGAGFSRRITSSTLLIQYPRNDEYSDSEVQAYINVAIQKVLRKQAEAYLPERTAQLADMFGYQFTSVSIRSLKRRWGSCNSKKEITFNLKLMELDTLHIDYVILHELTHTLHMNHGAEFWAHLESVLPGAKKIAKKVRHLDM